MTDLTNLTAGRKADRIKIAAEFRRVAEQFGAAVEQSDRTPTIGYSSAGISLSFSLNGVGAQVSVSDLHERCGSDGGLISWYNTDYPARHFTGSFNSAVGEQGSARPHHKATSIGSWDVLAARLQAGFRHAVNWLAFRSGSNAPKNYNWVRCHSGGWLLYDTAPGTPGWPIGSTDRYGAIYRGHLHRPPRGDVTAGSMGAAKARLLAMAQETEDTET